MTLAKDLEDLGAPRIEAGLLAHLIEHEEADTRQILEATSLRQPEVSIGMRRLRDRGWVECRPMAHHGKGRPMNHYRLTESVQGICDHYEAAARTMMERTRQALDSLLTRIAQRDSLRTPSDPATNTASQRPRNKPHSTTPG